jgi:hypothetical protein
MAVEPKTCLEQAAELKSRANRMRPGPERDNLIREARTLEILAHADNWIESPGLRPPLGKDL